MAYYALKKDVFDKSKISVVGSPTITSDGVASGFSGANAVISNYYMDFTKTNWKILTPKFSISAFSQNNPIISNYDSSTEDFLIFVRTNGKISWQLATSKGGTNIFKKDAPIGLQTNTNYQLKITFDGNKYKLYLATENGTFIEIDSVDTTTISTLKDCRLSIGRSISQGAVYMTTDLPLFKIYVDNQLVFQPVKPTYLLERRKPTVWNKGQFDIVGNPSISDDGIASGFSASDYVYSNISVNSNNVKLKFSFNYKSSENQQVWFKCIGASTANNLTNLEFGKFGGTGNMYIRATINGTANTYIYATNSFSKTWADGDLIECEFDLHIDNFKGQMLNKTQSTVGNINYIYATNELSFNAVNIGGYGVAGTIDLKGFKIYTKEEYDSKFTIVGSPTITADGVASGLSGSNYIRVPYQPLGQIFKIFTPKFNSSDVSQQQKIVRYSDGNIRIEIYQNKIRLYRYSGNNVYDLPAGQTTLQNNTDYYYYVEQTTDGTNYYLKGYISTDNKNWTLDVDKTYTVAMYDYQNNAPIQISGADANQPFIGTLGLKQFKIYTNNKLVFDGEPKDILVFDGGADTYVYDPSKFTIVGSPTITSNGVASGFTASNYVTSNYNLEENKTYTFEIEGIGGTPRTDRGSYIFVAYYNREGGGSDSLRLITGVNNGIVRFALGTGLSDVSTTLAILDGVKYKIGLKTDFKSFVTFTDLLTGYTLTKTGYNITNQTYGDNVIHYGANQGTAPLTNGSIDLPSISITVDGKEVFTGAKENYYMLSV